MVAGQDKDMSDFTIIDEFADMPPEIGDEWVDRHGVDRSPDAEAKRIDDAYEKYRDSPDATWPCKWCRMPNGDHHPDCVSLKKRPVTAADLLRIKIAQQTVEQRKAMEMEYEPEYGEPHIIPQAWKITASTEVFVSDNEGVLRGHRMKKDAVYGTDQVVVPDQPMRFRYPLTKSCEEISTTLADLVKAGFIVVQTGLSRWPYIIVEQKHATVLYCSVEAFVGEYGATCRKLGY